MNFLRCSSSNRKSRGFSLIEMLISVLIFTIVMAIVYTYLLRTKKHVISSEQELEAAENAQAAIQALKKDLLRIGLGRDSENEQPKLLRCSPYDIIFVADLDRDHANATDRYGAYVNGMPDDGSYTDFVPIRPYVTNPGDWGWDTSVEYGSLNIGAEIVRYSLDFNQNGLIDGGDVENAIAAQMDAEITHNQNPRDFWLMKEWWGCAADPSGAGWKNFYSGRNPVAYNIRGNLYGPSISSHAEFLYPKNNSEWPQLMFTYWGHFVNTDSGPHDDPGDDDWVGEPLDLWGDWGAIPPPLNNPEFSFTSGPSYEVNDGKLSNTEIQVLMTQRLGNKLWGDVFVLYPEEEDEDWNKNGVSGETRLDQVIRRIGITVTTEAGEPDKEVPNQKHSEISTNTLYNYRDYEISIVINPENLKHEGIPPIKVTPITPTPNVPTFTPTPLPPTPLPGQPSHTPTFTPSPGGPTQTPDAPTPDLTEAFNNDEIILGAQNGFLAIGLDHTQENPQDLCNTHNSKWYWLEWLDPPITIIDMESVNICDYQNSPDDWNDLLFAIDDFAQLRENLHYMQHRHRESVHSAFVRAASIRIGLRNQKIVAIETGNIDSSEMPEVMVAYYDLVNDNTYINIVKFSGRCGDFLDPSCTPFRIRGQVMDMEARDFDADGLTELAVIVNPHSDSDPELLIFDDLDNCNTGTWTVVHSMDNLFTDDTFPKRMDCGKIMSDNGSFADIAVISSSGQLVVIPNIEGVFQDAICSTNMMIGYPTGRDVAVYPPDMSATLLYDHIAVISDNPDHQMTNYHSFSGACNQISELTDCSGPMQNNTEILPTSLEWFLLDRTVDISLLTSLNFNQSSFVYELMFYGNPCVAAYPDTTCSIDVSNLGYTGAMTSTRNAHTGMAATPTPTPRPFAATPAPTAGP